MWRRGEPDLIVENDVAHPANGVGLHTTAEEAEKGEGDLFVHVPPHNRCRVQHTTRPQTTTHPTPLSLKAAVSRQQFPVR